MKWKILFFMTAPPPRRICYGSEIRYFNYVIVGTLISDLTTLLVSLWLAHFAAYLMVLQPRCTYCSEQIRTYLPNYTVSHPEGSNFLCHCCEKLRWVIRNVHFSPFFLSQFCLQYLVLQLHCGV